MKIVNEPLNRDFVLENWPLTKEEEKQISECIMFQKNQYRNLIFSCINRPKL
jgi:hypothetical protein